MPAYIVSMINVTDADKYKEYIALAGPATAKHGGRFIVRGGATEVLEGKFPFNRLVINEFPTIEQAKKFYNSPEYQEARAKRLLAADFNMVVTEGVA
jgi:uncharacterized protein (DUF1330 family)